MADITNRPNAVNPSNADPTLARYSNVVLTNFTCISFLLNRKNNLLLLAVVVLFCYCVVIRIWRGDIFSVVEMLEMLVIMLVITLFMRK